MSHRQAKSPLENGEGKMRKSSSNTERKWPVRPKVSRSLLCSNWGLWMNMINLLLYVLVALATMCFKENYFSEEKSALWGFKYSHVFVTHLLGVHFAKVPDIHVVFIDRGQIQQWKTNWEIQVNQWEKFWSPFSSGWITKEKHKNG